MFISEPTLDDLMHKVLTELINRPCNLISSRSSKLGPTSEMLGVMLHLQNPRYRLSRDEAKGTVFSALGELLWYLSKKNELEFITYYIKAYENESDDMKTVYGGYGPRIFNFRGKLNQIENVINLLTKKATSRKAVIQLFDAEDLAETHKEIPCTCTLQFFIREDRLHMFTSMRSNDAYRGLPHDIFAFTMIQEIMARSLNIEIGEYHHAVGSLHLYEKDKNKAEEYINAGFQPTTFPMPEMPVGQPWEAIQILLDIEYDLRNGRPIDIPLQERLTPYWADFARLLQAYSIFKKNKLKEDNINQLNAIKKSLSADVYKTYITKRKK
ncbi:thymidylate synthase [Larkinella rosea]|uniref:Thymidylate synthase n=1 Tax=Larkinella rosea TaxID=2025312 RepID=A0A3P1BEV7_9BACT|nr:thymidylate synthase [Larkinella rosea]RRA99213.1 thymidylate synthase [Larkinella rosea]